MKDFENIGKRMPYTEDKDYINGLIERTSETALHQHSKAKTVSLKTKWIAAAAVAVILIAGAGITYHHNSLAESQPMVAETTTSPIDDFLDNLTDEDAQLLAYYEIEEIPEFEEYQ